MVDICLDTLTHDIKFSEENDLILISDKTQFVQRLKIKLSTIFGEWFRNADDGIKYYDIENGETEEEDTIFRKNPNYEIIETMYKASILEEPESVELEEFFLEIDAENRKLTLDFVLTSTYGPIDEVIIIGGE